MSPESGFLDMKPVQSYGVPHSEGPHAWLNALLCLSWGLNKGSRVSLLHWAC